MSRVNVNTIVRLLPVLHTATLAATRAATLQNLTESRRCDQCLNLIQKLSTSKCHSDTHLDALIFNLRLSEDDIAR